MNIKIKGLIRLAGAALVPAIVPVAHGWVIVGATLMPAVVASQIAFGSVGVFWTTAVGFIPVWGWAAAAVVGL